MKDQKFRPSRALACAVATNILVTQCRKMLTTLGPAVEAKGYDLVEDESRHFDRLPPAVREIAARKLLICRFSEVAPHLAGADLDSAVEAGLAGGYGFALLDQILDALAQEAIGPRRRPNGHDLAIVVSSSAVVDESIQVYTPDLRLALG